MGNSLMIALSASAWTIGTIARTSSAPATALMTTANTSPATQRLNNTVANPAIGASGSCFFPRFRTHPSSLHRFIEKR
ncbi:hypothetical protein MOQ72_35295 [Saccharopolyspora sp. K220]|uniref:hypothetical protein n=1 Tax=Saccharopolyspora soli TaxID=2926618 RepID=UPI001F59D74B|nr:hypothetical protein [Saccharopolyspora soli]MCI2422705.1 hypothetical protein [Saccharopolyspora soli]